MLRRRLPVILLVAASVVLGIAIAGPPNQSRTPVITTPPTVSSQLGGLSPTSVPAN
jgi:hypothetical protein